jgi:Glycosyl hydrolases family 39
MLIFRHCWSVCSDVFRMLRKMLPVLLLPFCLSSLLLIVASQAAITQEISISVNWSQQMSNPTTSQPLVSTPLHFGLNSYQGNIPGIANVGGNANYRDGLNAMRPGLIRYHYAGQMADSTTDIRGWVKNPNTPNFSWDVEKITAAMNGAYPHNPTIMMNLSNFPAYLTDGSKVLKKSEYVRYGQFCAELVRILNVNLQKKIKYWEITNELDSNAYYRDNMAEVGEIFAIAAREMRKVDPTIKIGGPAFAQSYNSSRIDAFVSTAFPELDFISYHTYATGSKTKTNTEIWNSAQESLGGATKYMHASVKKFTSKAVEYFHNEYNISWSPPDESMTNYVSAIFDALAVRSILYAGATGATAWNEADGWYGKLGASPSFNRRPASWVFEYLNQGFSGKVLESTSSNPSALVPLAILGEAGGKKYLSLMLVNRSLENVSARLNMIAAQSWALPGASSQQIQLYRVNQSGGGAVGVSSLPYAMISGQPFSVEANSILFFTVKPCCGG